VIWKVAVDGLESRFTYICKPLVVVRASYCDFGVVLCDVNGPLRPPDRFGWHGLIKDNSPRAVCSEDHQHAAKVLV